MAQFQCSGTSDMHVKVDKEKVAECLFVPEENGLEAFIQLIEADDTWLDVRHAYYTIATVCRESNHDFLPHEDEQPVEYFVIYDPYTIRGTQLGNRREGDGYKYRRRGFVQMMGRDVYAKLGRALGVDLLKTPAMLDAPELAYKAMRVGMEQGLLTGYRLDTYIDADQVNYVEARRTINRLQDANSIASLAHMMEQTGAVTYAERDQQQSADEND